MWGLTKISAVLLATKHSTLKTTQDVAQDFRKLSFTFGEKASVYKHFSPTVKFSYVTPPTDNKDWKDDEVLFSDAHIMEDVGKDMFAEVAKKHGTQKPIALYLPGLDGSGMSAAAQFNDLSKTFELWRMTVTVDDRSSFGDLVKAVSGFADEIVASTDRPVYVIGESFGGLLAPAVTLRLRNREQRGGKKNPVKGLVLVNPATSFDQSNWDVVGPAFAALGYWNENNPSPFGLPSAYSVLGGLTLAALLPSSEQFQRIVNMISMSLEETTISPSRIVESIGAALDMLKILPEVLPPALVEHRIKAWMIVGSSLVKPRLSQLDVPTLIVVGRQDKLIGSRREVDRLGKILPQSEKLTVDAAGHFVLDDNLNLTEAIIYSKLDPVNFKKTSKPYDPILDWKLPPKHIIEEIMENAVKPLNDAFSPIYMSTGSNGRRSMGLDNLPREGPLLFVSNHQLSGLDTSFLVAKLLKSGIVVRGLAHPLVFEQLAAQRDELGGRAPGLSREITTGLINTNFRTFGAVMVTPRSYYRVMQSGQNALLFPGGVREMFHGRDEAYQLLWPEKVDFVRIAARFNATIIPISAVGMADSMDILLDSSELVDLPFIGETVKAFSASITSARFNEMGGNENFVPPLIAPRLPSRNYFIFGKALSTRNIDPKDKVACEEAYRTIQDELKRGFDDILKARKTDPFMEGAPRLAYERVTGQKAPTFNVKEVNNNVAPASMSKATMKTP